jgi:hypothetical protein
MASQWVPLAVCGSVFTIRVAERVSKEAECLTDTRLEMKARPLACKVSALCLLLKFCRNSAQLIYTHTVIIFEV